ncbi:MAG: 2-amino-4-hydroxy-6-hydroxymethyldihydropteridine diphosphokinase [Hyphomicrobiales bacterium]|nr:2-amino-4-hydroxy-6-hydroxymethyldihydropteridine diphosphokinase [Hyphomicrobiales bacterium]
MKNSLISCVKSKPESKNEVYLGLGGNMGDVKAHMVKALEYLNDSDDIDIVCASSIYETPPWGIEDQPAFLNMCIGIRTCLVPIDLLELCQRIEHSLNREHTIRWGPRTIDIDILLIEGGIVDLPELSIPHPRIKARAFVLVPLAEIAPEWSLDGRTIASWRQLCNDDGIKQVAGQEVFNDLIVKRANT